ncbi:hypothetical protein ScPMuIL_013747 [Solemya velum]
MRNVGAVGGIDTDDVIMVRGGLYEVDVNSQKCCPVYWTDDESSIMRGTWFHDGTWQPLEDAYSSQIETEHQAHFMGQKLDESPPPTKGQKPVIHHIRFQEFYVEWYSASEVYLFSESTKSKLMRSVGSKFGIQNSGSRLQRGYCYEAVMDDKPADIGHLVFVVHGIGQKMDTGNIVKRCKELRDRVNFIKAKYYPEIDTGTRRAEFLPVEWRSSLTLDGDTVESITPYKMKGVRTLLNSSAMDILYYTSPLYRSEIIHSLQSELNKLYTMFCERHPYFDVSHGQVSIIAHSLGSVISYDIVTGWNPIKLYDQFVTSVIDEEKAIADGSVELLAELEHAKQRVNDLESVLTKVHEKQRKRSPTLKFQIENLFCIGSPLAVFLALRGVRPSGKGCLDHIVPSSACKHLYNIYHPSDPVAYRLEPLILKHYAGIMPLSVHHFDDQKKTPYQKMKSRGIHAGKTKAHKSPRKPDSFEESDNSSREGSPVKKQVPSLFGSLFGKKTSVDPMFSGMKAIHMSELKVTGLKKMDKDIPAQNNSPKLQTESLDHTELEYRVDFQLKESSFESSYLAMVTSHTSYWTSKDVACFVLNHLHPVLQTS